jgi:hypothetical protein
MMPGWWLRQRALSRAKKDARKAAALRAAQDAWSYTPRRDPEPGPLKPYDPSPNPTSWYQFCTDRQAAYESRGDDVAAMAYWALRSFDLGKSPDPCTDEGYQELCDYWAYKMDWLEERQKPDERT